VRLSGHGISIELPARWTGRVFRRPAGNATLHAGDFQLALDDGEFGDSSTGRMPRGGSFVALVEYLPGEGLQPGQGLFAAHRIRLPLEPREFNVHGLAHRRPGQAGAQQFFTASGRPFCLYVVVSGPASARRQQLPVLNRGLRSLRIDQLGGGAAVPT
jgi:hypothetical protein